MPVTLTAEDLTVGSDHFKVPGISLFLESGDIFGLVGRSGSGKSTLISTLVGSRAALAGSLRFTVDGYAASGNNLIGYSPQRNALFTFLTVEENVRSFGELYGVPPAELASRAEQVLRRLGLWHHRNKRVTELSGGMEKRVDLAVTLIHKPSIIVLDEPFNGLDISLQRFIWGLLTELAQQGCIVIITSHLLEDVQKNCTSFGLIDAGVFYDNRRIRSVLTKNKTLQQFLSELFEREDAT